MGKNKSSVIKLPATCRSHYDVYEVKEMILDKETSSAQGFNKNRSLFQVEHPNRER